MRQLLFMLLLLWNITCFASVSNLILVNGQIDGSADSDKTSYYYDDKWGNGNSHFFIDDPNFTLILTDQPSQISQLDVTDRDDDLYCRFQITIEKNNNVIFKAINQNPGSIYICVVKADSDPSNIWLQVNKRFSHEK